MDSVKSVHWSSKGLWVIVSIFFRLIWSHTISFINFDQKIISVRYFWNFWKKFKIYWICEFLYRFELECIRLCYSSGNKHWRRTNNLKSKNENKVDVGTKTMHFGYYWRIESLLENKSWKLLQVWCFYRLRSLFWRE